MARSVETVYLLLKIDGADVVGEVVDREVGLEGAIECLQFEHRGEYRREGAVGNGTGRRSYDPLIVRKRIDRTSPMIWRAFVDPQANVEAELRFVRPDVQRNNRMEHFYTIHIENARVTMVRQFVPDKLLTASNSALPQEEVGFIFERITWKWNQGGIEYRDQWTGRA